MEYNQELFQKIMRRLIGSRTLADFAAVCGISRTNLSRLMSDHSYQPSKNTLRKIADRTDADYEELLSVCGYADSPAAARRQRSFADRIRLNAADMESGFASMTGNTRLYDSIRDFLEEYLMLYSHEDCRYIVTNEGEYEGNRPWIEKFACVATVFKETYSVCYTYAVIYFAETRGGRVVVLDTALDGKSLLEAGFAGKKDLPRMGLLPERVAEMGYVYYVRESKEGRMLRKILEKTEWYTTTCRGFGFTIEGMPDGFCSFLEHHILAVPDQEAFFRGYLDSASRAPGYFDHYRCGSSVMGGVTAVIASIMEAETGIPFEGFPNEDGQFPPCVMVQEDDEAYMNADFDELKRTVCGYARELGLKTYGLCLANGIICGDEDMQFQVEEEEDA